MTNPFKQILQFLFKRDVTAESSVTTPAQAQRKDLPKIELAFNGWGEYAGGSTLGSIGSESGVIVYDLECDAGARMTIERDGDIAPYSISFGIYGLMFHTHFCSALEEGLIYISKIVPLINGVFRLYDIPEGERDKLWQEAHDEALTELTQ